MISSPCLMFFVALTTARVTPCKWLEAYVAFGLTPHLLSVAMEPTPRLHAASRVTPATRSAYGAVASPYLYCNTASSTTSPSYTATRSPFLNTMSLPPLLLQANSPLPAIGESPILSP